MKIYHNSGRTIKLLLTVGLAAFVFTGLSLVNSALAKNDDDTTNASDTHLINIYDKKINKTIVTKAKTVREALDSAGIKVLEGKDVVEPGIDTELVASKYSINIFRAKPVTVIDGDRRIKITTAHQTPELIAKDAGIILHKEDKSVFGSSGNILIDGADVVMTIKRATKLNLVLYGKSIESRTMAATVGEFLREKNIKLGADDTLSIDQNSQISPDMKIEIWRNGKQTITAEEDVDFPIEKIKDANQQSDYRKIKEVGVKGKKTVTYEIEMRNGKEVSRKQLNSVITKEPKKQVETIGVKGAVAPYSGGGSKDQWLSASGIPRDQWGYVDWLVQKESGWNPNARNRSSGACGLAQALPCDKVTGNPYNPVDSLRWMNGYVQKRYGSWANAVNHSRTRGWY